MTFIFQTVIDLSLMGTLLTLLILLLKSLFGRRLSALWHYTIWFLLILRLVMPVAPENKLSLYNLSKPVFSVVEQKAEIGAAVPDIKPQPSEMGVKDQQLRNETEQLKIAPARWTSLPIMDILVWTWMTGALIMALIILFSNAGFYKRMRYCVPCRDGESLKLLKECHKTASVKRNIPLYLCESAGLPLLFGVVRPRLIISGQMLENLSEEEKRFIFLHELMHYRRRDILINWITAILNCIYWFNPVLFYAFYKMREDCEQACDESVLKKIAPAEYRSYGKTILNLLGRYSRSFVLASASGLITRKSSVKRRIIMIANYKNRTLLATLCTALLTILVGCSALTNASTKPLNKPVPSAPSGSQDQPTDAEPEKISDEMSKIVDELEKNSEVLEKGANELAEKAKELEDIQMYLDKLKDKSFTGTYGDGYTWYTAAEELGMIGKPAIPGLIAKLDTEDDYERALVLYALLLSTQHENVKSFTNGEYIEVNLDFNADSHPAMVEKAKAWWEKYKENF